MATLMELEEMVDALSPEDYSKFRKWMADRNFAEWDKEIEADFDSGKFEAILERTRREFAEGKSRPL